MDNEGNNMIVLKKVSTLLNRTMQHVSYNVFNINYIT